MVSLGLANWACASEGMEPPGQANHIPEGQWALLAGNLETGSQDILEFSLAGPRHHHRDWDTCIGKSWITHLHWPTTNLTKEDVHRQQGRTSGTSHRKDAFLTESILMC